ncbi:MAG: hypothetical protein HY083_03020 [Gammaproteobacteria bacterium]|nr:hypothetical protein [Gammaproteobacteria bacterium]
MVINIAEVAVLQKLTDPAFAVTLHYTAHILTLALLAHLATCVSLDRFTGRLFSITGMVIYAYALILVILIVFTPILIAGVEPIGNYTYTRIPGPLFWIYELFMLICLAAITVLPAWGLRKGRDETARNRCKLWLALSTPLVVLVLTVLVLLHFGFRWFNATVTTPLLIAMFMAAVGYTMHHYRPIDLNFYLPGSHVKKFKTRLYAKLATFSREIPHFRTVNRLLEQLATILGCPVALVSQHIVLHDTSANSKLSSFPISALHDIRRMMVTSEIRECEPRLHALMSQYSAAAIVPLFPHSSAGRHWLLLGKPFSRSIYMPQDFRHIERLFGMIAGLLLDKLLQTDRNKKLSPTPKTVTSSLKKSLPESVAEFEAKLIRQALASCHGNQARAARLLGIQPNTLYYKIERYGLSAPSTG